MGRTRKKSPAIHAIEYLMDSINPDEYPTQPAGYSGHASILWVETIIKEERGVEGLLSPLVIEEWLRGMPTCLPIEEDRVLIEKILRDWDYIHRQDSETTIGRCINQWWQFMASRLNVRIVEAHRYAETYRYEVQKRNGTFALELYKGTACEKLLGIYKVKKHATDVQELLEEAFKLGGKNA